MGIIRETSRPGEHETGMKKLAPLDERLVIWADSLQGLKDSSFPLTTAVI
jgi:hypothetical protein